MMKTLLCLGILFLVSSCGNKSGENSQSPNLETIDKESALSDCHVKFTSEDFPSVAAKKANQARVECGLNEEQIVKLVK